MEKRGHGRWARAALAACALVSCAPAAPRSVLLVTIDTLRADHLSAYGYAVPTSPGLARLARRGVRFERAFAAASYTAPSHASIMTGRYASFHSIGLLNLGRLHAAETTLAELLARQGYRTAAVVSNFVLRAELGLDQGFELYDDDFEGHERRRSAVGERYADRAVDLALKWLDALAPPQPFFLWLHLQDPHGPYAPPRERFQEHAYPDADVTLPAGSDHSGHRAIPRYQLFDDEQRVGVYVRRYDSEIAFLDQHLQRLLAHLDAQPRFRNTLVALTADHGEALGEDGFYFAHGHSTGLELVRVPLILAGPGLTAGRIVPQPVSNVALFASVLEFVGLEPPDGVVQPSLLQVAAGQASPRAVFVESLNQGGIVSGNAFLRRDRRPADDTRFWKGRNPNTGSFWKPLGRQWLSPLDPSGAPPTPLAQVEEHLEAFERRAHEARSRQADRHSAAPLDPRAREILRSLGYVN